MKNTIMQNRMSIILIFLVICLICNKSYSQSTYNNYIKTTITKKVREDDKRIRMVIPEEKYLDSIRTLKVEGYTIDSQVYDRKNRE